MFSVRIPRVGISTGPSLETSAPQDSSPLASTSTSSRHNRKLKTLRKRDLKRGMWAVTSMEGTKLCMKKRRRANFRPEDQEAFYRLLEDPVIQSFLEADVFLRVSDKYLLSMVVEYFGRVGLPGDCYNRIHFFLALYIACDMEEDNPVSKWSIFPFVLGKEDWPILYKEFLRLQAEFFHAMGGRAWVTPEICEEACVLRDRYTVAQLNVTDFSTSNNVMTQGTSEGLMRKKTIHIQRKNCGSRNAEEKQLLDHLARWDMIGDVDSKRPPQYNYQ